MLHCKMLQKITTECIYCEMPCLKKYAELRHSILHCGILYLKKYAEPRHSMLHCGMLYLKTNIPGRDATCYELQHGTQLSGVQILDHLRTSAMLTLQDDNNGTGNDIGIERKRYHGKELVSR